jgi:hypothetical protein
MQHEDSYIVVKEFTDNGKKTREVIATGVTKQGFIYAYTEKGCVMRGGENPHFEDIYSGIVYKLEKEFEQGGQIDRERDIQIAKTILMQMGGSNRLQMFTGAYNFVAVPYGVSFRIKNRKVNYVKIVLNAMDTYDVEFGLIRGANYKVVKELNGIYNDQLVEVFTRYTGMVLRLRKGGAIQGEENAEMVMNQNLQIRHHTKELEEILKSGKEVPAWVVSKLSRAADSISDATHYLEGTPDKMAMGGAVSKEYEAIPNTTYELKIQVYYDKGGMNYYSGGTNKRGYYLSVTPVQIQRQGNVMIESYTAFSGIKKLILEVERQSEKSAQKAKELAEYSIPELKQYVLNQMIKQGQIPQALPMPEPEPMPDEDEINPEEIRAEIEALEQVLEVLEGEDRQSIQEEIEILKLALGDNMAEGGGVGELPPKGELTNKDNFLLKYEKKGGDYEFYIYKPETKKVSGYNQVKHICVNSDCPHKMTYEQFINYLYAELYLDDMKYANGGEIFVCPVGTEIQTLIFDKSMFNLRQAKAWAKKNNFENAYVDGKLNTLRIRQKDPAMFTEDGFRTIQLRQGVQAVIGCPKRKISRKR